MSFALENSGCGIHFQLGGIFVLSLMEYASADDTGACLGHSIKSTWNGRTVFSSFMHSSLEITGCHWD